MRRGPYLECDPVDARARALELVDKWHRELRRLLPAGADIFDAHLHLGHDIDGMVGDYAQLIELMDDYGMSRASCSASTSPTGTPPSARRTTARSRTRSGPAAG